MEPTVQEYEDKLFGKMSEFPDDAMTESWREVMKNFESKVRKVKNTRTSSSALEESSSRESHGFNRCYGFIFRRNGY